MTVHVDMFLICILIYLRLAAPAPKCSGRKPMCNTCLYASNADSCDSEGYQEDCSAMTDVRLLDYQH